MWWSIVAVLSVNVTVLTAYDGKTARRFASYEPRLLEYCARHDYTYLRTTPIPNITPSAVSRRKIHLLHETVSTSSERDHWLMWLDPNVVVQTPSYDVRQTLSSLPPRASLVVLLRDNALDLSIVLVRRHRRARAVLHAWMARVHHPRGYDQGGHASWALDDLLLTANRRLRKPWTPTAHLIRCGVDKSGTRTDDVCNAFGCKV